MKASSTLAYKDHYRQKVKAAIEAKKNGVDLSTPEEEEPEVINLMDALRRSVANAGAKDGNSRHATNGRSRHSSGTKSRHGAGKSHSTHRRRD